MFQASSPDAFQHQIADQMEFLRGADYLAPFQAISALTIEWVVRERPTRRKVIQQFSVTPEQLFNVVLFYKNKSTCCHNSTWAKIASAHLLLDANNFRHLQNESIDAGSFLSSLESSRHDLAQKIPKHNIRMAIDHLRIISYSSRLPESLKKKL